MSKRKSTPVVDALDTFLFFLLLLSFVGFVIVSVEDFL